MHPSATRLDEITGSASATAISAFRVPAARLHWDMTSIALYGAYSDRTESAGPRWWLPEERGADGKVMETGVAVSGDGGVRVGECACGGGALEVAEVGGVMTGLRKIAGLRR